MTTIIRPLVAVALLVSAGAARAQDYQTDFPPDEFRARWTGGMAVHDVGSYRGGPLKPGQVFSIDPQLRVPEEHLYPRYEDTIVVTERGYENFTDFLPSELSDLETLAQETGVVQKIPS